MINRYFHTAAIYSALLEMKKKNLKTFTYANPHEITERTPSSFPCTQLH